MTELKEMDKIYLEKYDIHVTPYLTYAQIEQMLKAVGEIFDWAERQVSIDMLLLAHTTDIPVEELDKAGHKALFESGLIIEVKKNIINLHDWEKALEYHTSFQKNMATVLKKVTPELMDKVMAIVKPSKK